MNIVLIGVAVFLLLAILLVALFYLFIAGPAQDRTLRTRLRTIQNSSSYNSDDSETELLRHEVMSKLPALQRLFLRIPFLVDLNLFIQQAGIELSVGRLIGIVLIIIMAILIVGLVMNLPIGGLLILGALCGSIPFLFIAVRRNKRFAKFDEQFPDALDLLARAVRAGHAFTTGLELVGNEMPEPVAEEFRRTFEQQNIGLPLRDALKNLLVRIPLPDVHVFVTALLIQRESGGNLAEILDNISHVIRERFKLAKQVRVLTAQGRMSLYILTALPPISGLGLYAINKGYINRLFTDPLGQKMLVTAVCLQVIGYYVISRIVRPKV